MLSPGNLHDLSRGLAEDSCSESGKMDLGLAGFQKKVDSFLKLSLYQSSEKEYSIN